MKISLKDLQEKALSRPAGYVEDVIAHGTLKEGWIEISGQNYRKMLNKYNPEASMPVVSNCCGGNKPRNIPTREIGTGSYNRPTGSFPPMIEQLGNAAGALGRVVGAAFTGNKIKASEETVANRLSICNSCEFNKNNRCLKCGCYWKAKMQLETERCPAGKW